MNLVSLVLVLVVVGVILWAINRFIPMAAPIKTIINILVVIVVALWLLEALGVDTGISNISLN